MASNFNAKRTRFLDRFSGTTPEETISGKIGPIDDKDDFNGASVRTDLRQGNGLAPER